MSEGLRLDPEAACDGCGQYGAFRFEAETLCGDCYANRGACCSAEFSGRPPECDAVVSPGRERRDEESRGPS